MAQFSARTALSRQVERIGGRHGAERFAVRRQNVTVLQPLNILCHHTLKLLTKRLSASHVGIRTTFMRRNRHTLCWGVTRRIRVCLIEMEDANSSWRVPSDELTLGVQPGATEYPEQCAWKRA